MPRFSIIIPVFNRATLVKNTINSVYNQKCKEYELIIVDDGSTDSLEFHLLQEITDKKLKYVYQSNQGVSSARNRGAVLANGEYLLFLDSDDKVTENWLLDYEQAIIEYHPDVVYCGINRIKGVELVGYSDPRDPYDNSKDFGNVLPGSFCIRKSYFEQIGKYDVLLAYGENTELGFRIKMGNPNIAFIARPNLLYTIQENSHSKNEKNKMNGLLYTLKKHQKLFKNNIAIKKRFLSIAGVAAIKCNENVIARTCLLMALIINPFDLKSLLRYIIFMIPMLRKKVWK